MPFKYWRSVEISLIRNINRIRIPKCFDCAQHNIVVSLSAVEDLYRQSIENYIPKLLLSFRIRFSTFSRSGTVVISFFSASRNAFRAKVSYPFSS